MIKFKPVVLEEVCYFYSLSFDIDDFIGDGIWWLQIYDSDKQMMYDKPFASSKGDICSCRILETINSQLNLEE